MPFVPIFACLVALLAPIASHAQFDDVRLEDGAMYFDGAPYADLEGNVLTARRDLQNGDIGFVVSVGEDRIKLKYMPGGQLAETKTLAQGRRLRKNGRWSGVIMQVMGAEVPADNLYVMPRGAALSRAGGIVRIFPDGAARAFPITGGWEVLGNQYGDYGETEFMAIKRPINQNKLFSMNKEQFALINTANGNIQVLAMQPPAQLPESYENDLRQRMDWAAIGDRKFAITLNKGLKEAILTDLETGETKLAGKRGLGISSVRLERQGDKLWFKSDIGNIGDVELWWSKADLYPVGN